MRCVQRGDDEYDSDRRISNARFNYYPRQICYCEHDQDVQNALAMATRERYGVRIRSGGHQHEGMCSGDGVLMVDLSKINHIQFADRGAVSIGPGARLRDVYDQVFDHHLLFPGGGCGDVCVGGLVQGGGWGPYARLLGLTCDRLIGVRMVKTDGTVIEVTDAPNDPHHQLLWAVRGGGGGNFGVVTEFRFRLIPIKDRPLSFSVTWSNAILRRDVVEEWRHNFPDDNVLELTSYCRLTVVEPGSSDKPVLVGGGFVGDAQALDRALARLLPTTYPQRDRASSAIQASDAAPSVGQSGFLHPEYQPGPPPAALGDALTFAAAPPGGLADTCAGQPFPHKVSSCFPKASFGEQQVDAILTYLANSEPEPAARRYLSLHSFGGRARTPNPSSSFAFRDKPFMLQYQAWWAQVLGNPGLGPRCMEWVRGFREALKDHTEGSFINFPDKDLVAHPETPEGREKLLAYYYSTNLDGLITVKRTYDPLNVLDFEMGIPTQLC